MTHGLSDKGSKDAAPGRPVITVYYDGSVSEPVVELPPLLADTEVRLLDAEAESQLYTRVLKA